MVCLSSKREPIAAGSAASWGSTGATPVVRLLPLLDAVAQVRFEPFYDIRLALADHSNPTALKLQPPSLQGFSALLP